MAKKKIDDVCVLVQARLGSTRLPKKMLKPFCGTTLIDILFKKLKSSKVIPLKNIYFSAYENELKEVAFKHNINIFHRSESSANSEGQPMTEIYEWHNKLPFKYVVLISACNPLLKIETIDSFFKSFVNSQKEGGFAVFEKKTYYWDTQGKPITKWGDIPWNTKFIDPIYEAAHCLYASRMNIISSGHWIDINNPPEPELFVMNELESFDIDYAWQFDVAEALYSYYGNF